MTGGVAGQGVATDRGPKDQPDLAWMISAPRVRVTETGGALRYSALEAKASNQAVPRRG